MSAKFGKVALLLGGDSPEREVSLTSAAMVGEELDKICAEVIRFDPAQRGLMELADLGVESVFNILHGGAGEDGRIQAALELMGLPFTGSRHLACALAMDKELSKVVWVDAGLPTPMWHVASDNSDATLDVIQLELGEDLFVKPCGGGSSIAATPATGRQELAAAIAAALAVEPKILVEQRVEGLEITYGVVGDEVLPGIRIETDRDFYDYEAKYDSDTTRYVCPANLQDDLDQQARQLSSQAFKALGCSGWGRVDLMVSGRDVFLLEVNTIPGMTSHSLVPKAAVAAGWSHGDLVGRILELAK